MAFEHPELHPSHVRLLSNARRLAFCLGELSDAVQGDGVGGRPSGFVLRPRDGHEETLRAIELAEKLSHAEPNSPAAVQKVYTAPASADKPRNV